MHMKNLESLLTHKTRQEVDTTTLREEIIKNVDIRSLPDKRDEALKLQNMNNDDMLVLATKSVTLLQRMRSKGQMMESKPVLNSMQKMKFEMARALRYQHPSDTYVKTDATPLDTETFDQLFGELPNGPFSKMKEKEIMFPKKFMSTYRWKVINDWLEYYSIFRDELPMKRNFTGVTSVPKFPIYIALINRTGYHYVRCKFALHIKDFNDRLVIEIKDDLGTSSARQKRTQELVESPNSKQQIQELEEIDVAILFASEH